MKFDYAARTNSLYILPLAPVRVRSGDLGAPLGLILASASAAYSGEF